MFIKQITNQHRRDFRAIYRCQFCGGEQAGRGYDDENFHVNVIPTMQCEMCGKSTESEGDDTYRPLSTKYEEGYQI